MKVIVLSRNDYSFAEKSTGELIEGSKITYIFENGIEPIYLSINNHMNNTNLKDEIIKIPGIYDLTLKTDVRKGQMVQCVESAKFLREIDLFSEIDKKS